jgi:2-methylcitrate dehydratase PrpD
VTALCYNNPDKYQSTDDAKTTTTLDEAQMAVALGLAGTQAAGLKSMFGTMAKAFHAGRAAANGVLAAGLAGH